LREIVVDRLARLLRDLEANGPSCFTLANGCSIDADDWEAYENNATEPSEPSNNTGPKDPPSDQSTYQDPNDDEDVLDEDSPDEPDNDED
jgi:hypothetical protein